MKLPKNEIIWYTCCDESHNPKFIITSKSTRDTYFLYKVIGKDDYEKLPHQFQDPTKLYQYMKLK